MLELDPTVKALFERMPVLARYPLWEKSPEDARQDFKALWQSADPKVAIGKTEDIEIPGPQRVLKLRVYTPVAAGGSLAAIVYFHGGGFAVGDLDTHDALCRALANESGARLIAVDYRLAPEFKFPAAVDDCFAALKWVEANAPALNIDPNRIVVAGDSAGGNLAAVTCLLAKDNKNTPHIAFQLLVYPATNLGARAEEISSPSGCFLDSRTLAWSQGLYLPPDADLKDSRLSPLSAQGLSGLPPAYIITTGFDPLRADGVAYAEKLKAAGVKVTHVDYPTMIHGFLLMQAWIPLAAEAIAAAAKAVKDALKD